MKYLCLIDFERDKNVSGKTYWYKSNFPFNVGDEVVAPLNVRNKLQIGRIKKIVNASDEDFKQSQKSDKSVSLDGLKSIICKRGARRVKIPFCRDARDLGGLFYDEKHVTAYGNFIRGEPPEGNLFSSGIDKVIYIGERKPLFEGAEFIAFSPSSENGASSDFASAFYSFSFMKNIFKSISECDGTIMLCGDFCVYVDVVVAVLYLLCGVSLTDIAKDREFSFTLLKGGNQQNVNCENCEKFLSDLREFKKNYPDVKKYLLEIGLNSAEISDIESRMKSVSHRYVFL